MLARDLTNQFGAGFSRSNISRMRQLYLAYPKCATLSHKLSWSHYVELLKIDDPQERSFYLQECEQENWGVRELKRQMNLYLNYYREEMNTPGDTEPIGIVMGAYEDKLMVKYATQNISNQLFVSRYQLYLPDKDQLENEIRRFMDADAAREK